ncbi:hypothetical protein CVT26_015582 [Gymnopilus dilepis]|uniref:Uncharacterized protein n=1 Tax=Gymnopilus dilepis TaxID=231916 RepID=A0A409XYR8_9AGAR|nr:hypothetical protein CVT26_015582 [Gymnopilus dilepis]
MDQPCSHPEIESRSLISPPHLVDDKAKHRSLIDLLEVYSDHVVQKKQLDHAELLDHFPEIGEHEEVEYPPALRVFFIGDLEFGAGQTASWFRQRFGVSPLFLECVRAPRNGVTIGNASFLRRGQGRCTSLDGIYRYSPGLAAPDEPARPPVHVWFSLSCLESGVGSTYLIHKCPEDAKEFILSCAQGPDFRSLLRPLSVDMFLAEDCIQKWSDRVAQTRRDLLQFEGPLESDMDHEKTEKAVESLYQLSQLFQIIRDVVADVQDQLEFLSAVFNQKRDQTIAQSLQDGSVSESLQFLISKNQIMLRWVKNYTERTQVQISRFFNHATQKDNAVNVNISQLTSKIAVSTQKDSSAMITMAAVTMVFLPGSFVSALFSTVFFDTAENRSGNVSLLVHPQWWLFPAIVIPLTIAVFLIWIVWWQIRNQMALAGLSRAGFSMGSTLQLNKISIHGRGEETDVEKVEYPYAVPALSSADNTSPRAVYGYRFE